jgi:hypothetical protein
MAASRKLLKRFGERGRNRTFNLLIKSRISQSADRVYKSGADNNLTIKLPAWTVLKKR